MQAEIVNTAAPELQRAERRLPYWMKLVFFAALVPVAVLWGWRFSAAFTLGAALGILNYQWLHETIATVFNASFDARPNDGGERVGAGSVRVPKAVVLKLLLRYPLAFGLVYVFYRTGWLPFMGILAGFFVPVAGVLLEMIVQIREGLRE